MDGTECSIQAIHQFLKRRDQPFLARDKRFCGGLGFGKLLAFVHEGIEFRYDSIAFFLIWILQ
jgi:hypothetical protein